MEKMKLNTIYSQNYFYAAEVRMCDEEGKNCRTAKKHGIYTCDDHPRTALLQLEYELLAASDLSEDVAIVQFNKI